VSKNVDEFAKGIAHEETSNAPRLVDRAIFDRNPCRFNPAQGGIEIVDFNDKSGVGAPEPPLAAKVI
jgi:hypothetical protein